jgi:hypothetical protein
MAAAAVLVLVFLAKLAAQVVLVVAVLDSQAILFLL